MEFHTVEQATRPTRGAGVSEVGDDEVRRVTEALDALEAIEDPVARARAVSALLKDQRTRNPRLRADRDQTVRALRDKRMSLRTIAEAVGLSLGTVQDILRGHVGTWTDRPKQREQQSAGPDQPV
jgi:hypothetical protein